MITDGVVKTQINKKWNFFRCEGIQVVCRVVEKVPRRSRYSFHDAIIAYYNTLPASVKLCPVSRVKKIEIENSSALSGKTPLNQLR